MERKIYVHFITADDWNIPKTKSVRNVFDDKSSNWKDMLFIDGENLLDHVPGGMMFYFLNYCRDQYCVVFHSVTILLIRFNGS